MSKNSKIIFVDDENKSTKYFKRLFSDRYLILTASNQEEAEALLADNLDTAVIISDQRMQYGSGLDLLIFSLRNYPKVVRIISTAYSDYNVVVDAINEAKVFGYIDKPWDLEKVSSQLSYAVEYHKIGNNVEGLMDLQSPSSSSINSIIFPEKDLHDIETILRVVKPLNSQTNQHNSEGIYKISQYGSELQIEFKSNSNGHSAFTTLSEFRARAANKKGTPHLEIIESTSKNNPSTLELNNSNFLSKEQTTSLPPRTQQIEQLIEIKFSYSHLIQVKKSISEIIISLIEIQRKANKGSLLLSKSKEIKRFTSQTKSLIRKLEESNNLDIKDTQESIPFSFLKSYLENFIYAESWILKAAKLDLLSEQNIISLFISHNSIAAIYGKTSYHPDPSLLQSIRIDSEKQKEIRAIIIFGALLLFGAPIIYIAIFYLSYTKSLSSQKMASDIVGLVASTLISGIGGSLANTLLGKVKLNQKTSLGIFGRLTVAATGGIATFIFIFSVSLYILFFRSH